MHLRLSDAFEVFTNGCHNHPEQEDNMDDIDTFLEEHPEDNGIFVNHAMINEALGKFFDRGGRLVEDEEPTKKPIKKRVRKPRPEPTIHELCKEVADQEWKKPEAKRQFGMSVESGKASRKKSQAKQVMRQRILCEHLRNPEETFSFNNDGRIHG